LLLLALWAWRLCGAVVVQPVLSLTQIQLTNAQVFQWTEADPQVGGSGGGSLAETSYSGPAWLLSAQFLIDGRWVVEYSMDLQEWQPYPSAGFQLTLTPTNTTGVIFSAEQKNFFRVRYLAW